MKLSTFAIVCALGLNCTAFAHGDDHHHHHKEQNAVLKSPGVDALKNGDLQTAEKLLRGELEKDPGNPRLKTVYSGLKVTLRRVSLFEQEKNPDIAVRLGRQIRGFYLRYGLFERTLEVDRRICELQPNDANTVSCAVTLLNLDRNNEAAALFSKTDLAGAKPGTVLCAALAYARIGDRERAAKLYLRFPMGKMKLNELKLCSRAAAVNGDKDIAVNAVRLIMKQSPDHQRQTLNKQWFPVRDYDKIRSTPEFQAALATPADPDARCEDCPNRHAGHGNDRHRH
ncbi:MAG: hypothetical protein MR051_05775 [Lentisphaeria bacterium]|nr:hypothetical protein [Lentisphaeria bacterium]